AAGRPGVRPRRDWPHVRADGRANLPTPGISTRLTTAGPATAATAFHPAVDRCRAIYEHWRSLDGGVWLRGGRAGSAPPGAVPGATTAATVPPLAPDRAVWSWGWRSGSPAARRATPPACRSGPT